MDPERKRLLLATFEQWVDELDSAENLPEGFPASAAAPSSQPDFQTLVRNIVALTEEVRVQGRGFRRLTEEIQAWREPPAASETPSQVLEQSREEGRSEILVEVIDLHDRFWRMREEVVRSGALGGFLERLFGPPRDRTALLEGLSLLLGRFGDFLHRYGIERFGSPGEPFDPNHMQAIDAVTVPGLPAGQVVGTIAGGYRRSGRLLRTAKVQVSMDTPPQRKES